MDLKNKTFLSIVLPCYNEEAILSNNLNIVIGFLESKREKYSWEILIINDGSKDKTATLQTSLLKNINPSGLFITL